MDAKLCAQILGQDFISPEEVESAGFATYSSAQRGQLAAVMPPQETVERMRRDGFGLIPQLTSRDFLKEIPLTEIEHVALPSDHWLAIKKTPVQGSGFLTWCEQLQLLTEEERVPSVLEAAWFLLVFRTVRQQYLWRDVLRTGTQDVSASRSLIPRHFAVRELRGSEVLFSIEDGYAGMGVGISAAWKL